jgi:hypothetical protein
MFPWGPTYLLDKIKKTYENILQPFCPSILTAKDEHVKAKATHPTRRRRRRRRRRCLTVEKISWSMEILPSLQPTTT